jgi:hypothetical protein
VIFETTDEQRMPRREKQPHGGTIQFWLPGESGNRKGRPRKLVSGVLKGMKEAGVEPVSASQVAEVMETMLNATKDELLATAQDAEQPFIIRLVAKELLSKQGWFVLSSMLDRAHGKPGQRNAPDQGSSPENRTTIELPGGLTIDL